MPRLLPRRFAPLLLAAAATLVGLFGLEAGCRARARFATPASLTRAPLGPVAPGARARLGNIVRLSREPRIVYELVPGLDVEFMGARLRTGADGFRGPTPAPQRTRPAVRVVGLGDSVMFGWGVGDEQCYLARLRPRLEAAHPGVAWEIVNTAVPGYNTVMEVETLAAKGLRFDPDLVLLNFVGNDLGLPNFVEERPDLLALDRSFLLDFVRARLAGGPDGGPSLQGVGPELRRAWQEADLARVPPRYRPLVGMRAWRGAMDRLARLSRERGFEVLLLAHPQAPGFVHEAARAIGLPVLETRAAIEAWGREHGGADPGRPPLALSDGDPHPSPLGHEIVARALADELRASGLAGRLAARRSAGRAR